VSADELFGLDDLRPDAVLLGDQILACRRWRRLL
jgi:hypothetical protein